MPSKLDRKVSRVCGVLNLSKDSTYDEMVSFREKFIVGMENYDYCLNYFVILHDDSDTLHLHYIVLLQKPRRVINTLNDIAQIMGIEQNQVSIDVLSNLNAQLRYFVHLNEDKKQYPVTDIKSNLSLPQVSELINNTSQAVPLSSIQLITYVLLYPHEADLMVVLGLDTYHKYRSEIKMLYEQSMYLNMKYKYLLNENNAMNLPF